MIRLSVIVPVYNVESYISKCLNSVLSNGMDLGTFEIIVVDDESTDSSIDIVKKTAENHESIVIISQKNKGLGGARNTGIAHSKGAYIVFLDADDWYLPGTLNQLLSISDAFSLDVLEFGAQGIATDGQIKYTRALTSKEPLTGMQYYQENRYLDSACNKMYRSGFIKNWNFRFQEKIYIEDFEFNSRIFHKAIKVLGTDLIVAQFLQSPNSITRNTNGNMHVKMQEDIITVIKLVNSYSKPHMVVKNSIETKYFSQRLSYLTATLFFQLLKKGYSYSEMLTLKKRLQAEQIFFIDHHIFDKKKELFRTIFLKNFSLMRLGTLIYRFTV